MSTPIEKLDLRSLSITDEKHAQLKQLFPEVFTEAGKIDFDRLKLVLGETVDVGKERYGMTWPGKADCFKTIQRPSVATLRPCREESVNFDTTENVIIEGDNLEVLKLLQKAYLGKVKMIYIDPPYNTGNDFIYPDNYTEGLQTYLEYTGQVDSEGRKFSTNTQADGRFHSKWLNLLYPRLYLARNLLKDDGVIFISIDDNEAANLRKICDEVFGEENFIAQLVVLTNPKGRVMDRHFSRTHDYVLAYSREIMDTELSLPKTNEEVEEDYPERDEQGKFRLLELRNTHRQFGKFNRPKLWYPLFVDPATGSVSLDSDTNRKEIWPRWDDGFEGCWTWGTDKAKSDEKRLIALQVNGRWKIFRKAYSHSDDGEVARKKLKTILIDKNFYTERGQAAFDELMPPRLFQSPKPVGLVETLVRLATGSDDIVLDFFAGSGTTAQAVLEVNRQDNSNRRFVLVQMPEPIENSEFRNLADITKERVRRAIHKIEKDVQNRLQLTNSECLNLGFKAFRLDTSNFTAWIPASTGGAESLESQLQLHVEHIQPGRTPADLLYELILKSGFPLTTAIAQVNFVEKTIYSLAGGALLICLDEKLTSALLQKLSELRPERVVCLDEGFAGNDQLKTNTVQLMKSRGIVFRTV